MVVVFSSPFIQVEIPNIMLNGISPYVSSHVAEQNETENPINGFEIKQQYIISEYRRYDINNLKN